MALWQLGLLTMAYSELLADFVSNEDESKIFSYKNKPKIPAKTKKESWFFCSPNKKSQIKFSVFLIRKIDRS